MPFLSEQDLEGNEGEAEEEVLTGWAKKEAHALGGAGVGSRAAHFCMVSSNSLQSSYESKT